MSDPTKNKIVEQIIRKFKKIGCEVACILEYSGTEAPWRYFVIYDIGSDYDQKREDWSENFRIGIDGVNSVCIDNCRTYTGMIDELIGDCHKLLYKDSSIKKTNKMPTIKLKVLKSEEKKIVDQFFEIRIGYKDIATYYKKQGHSYLCQHDLFRTLLESSPQFMKIAINSSFPLDHCQIQDILFTDTDVIFKFTQKREVECNTK